MYKKKNIIEKFLLSTVKYKAYYKTETFEEVERKVQYENSSENFSTNE
ncbi:MAG: hypothetical protein WAO56_05465 [Miniphocaeibacter sp.]|nr:hypothetical protein [Gallicola sp.]